MARRLPCALAIGGLDPGGGAGVLADVRAFAAAGAFGCAAVAVLTVQSTSGMRSARALDAAEVVAQAREVIRAERVRAVKVGALGSRANVDAVAALLARARIPAVVDTPMLPTRGKARLLADGALDAVRERLLPRAALVTVNAPEAEALVGARVASVGEAHDAALSLRRMGARAALVKGGHLSGPYAIDVLAVGDEVIELRAKRLPRSAHGTGCVLASLVAGRIAVAGRADDAAIVDAVRWSKRAHHAALAGASDVGGAERVLVP